MEELSGRYAADSRDIATICVIVAAARALFLAYGPQSVTRDEIAQTADLHPATIARYFESDEHICAAVVRAHCLR